MSYLWRGFFIYSEILQFLCVCVYVEICITKWWARYFNTGGIMTAEVGSWEERGTAFISSSSTVFRGFWFCNKERRMSKEKPRNTKTRGDFFFSLCLHMATWACGLRKTFLARVQPPPPSQFSSLDGHGTTLRPCGQQEAVFKPGQLWNGP